MFVAPLLSSDICIVSTQLFLVQLFRFFFAEGIYESPMKRFATSFCLALLVPAAVQARSYSADVLPYLDTAPNRSAAIAVSVLTQEGIVKGNPDGTFRYGNLLNRAEFLKIVMALVPNDGRKYSLSCFPDVPLETWFTAPVCRAKALGIISGNVLPGLTPDQWPFAPERPVQYAEALKILVEIFEIALPTQGAQEEWFVRYFRAAQGETLTLAEDKSPGYHLRRSDMARLVVRFMAHADDELDLLEIAEAGPTASSASSVTTMLHPGQLEIDLGDEFNSEPTDIELDESLGGESSSSSSSVDTSNYDPDTDVTVRPGFLRLGTTSPVLAAANVFSELQPLAVNDLVIRMTGATPSVSSVQVFDHDGIYLGTAYLDPSYPGDRQYKLPFATGELEVPKAQEYSFYVRADIKHKDAGGTSADTVEVEKMGVEGDGAWNNKAQSAYTSKDFPAFQTARSVITEITNPGSASDVLIAGQQVRMGSFRFKGEKGDGGADLAVTDLVVNMDQTGGVTVSNVQLGADGISERIVCSVASNIITCSSIPESYGSFEDLPRILTFYGDISIPPTASKASLQLKINEPGSILSAGSVTWTDGTTSFTWVAGETPVVRSTLFSF